MRKLRILSFVLLLAIACALLAACTDGIEAAAIGEMYNLNNRPAVPSIYKTVTDVTLLENATLLGESDGALLAYTRPDGEGGALKYYVYNVDLDKNVFEATANTAENQGFVIELDYPTFIVYTKDTRTTAITESKLYFQDGTLLASAVGEQELISDQGTGVLFSNMLFVATYDYAKQTITAVTKVCDFPALFVGLNKPYVTQNYVVDTFDDAAKIIFYDKSLNYKCAYVTPGHATNAALFLLADETVLVQYQVLQDPNATEYDMLDGDKKYNVVHEKFDPATGESEPISLDVYLAAVMNENLIPTYQDQMNANNVPNLILYLEMTDRLLNQTIRYGAMNNDGEIMFDLDRNVSGQTSMPTALLGADNLYYAELISGYGLLDGNGTLLKQVSALPTVTSFGFLCDKTLYNRNFEELVTCATVLNVTTHGVLYLSDEGHLKLYTADGDRQLAVATDLTSNVVSYMVEKGSEYYCIRTRTDANTRYVYTYYSMDGAQLFVLEQPCYTVPLVVGENAMIVWTSGANETTGYHIYKRVARG